MFFLKCRAITQRALTSLGKILKSCYPDEELRRSLQGLMQPDRPDFYRLHEKDPQK